MVKRGEEEDVRLKPELGFLSETQIEEIMTQRAVNREQAAAIMKFSQKFMKSE